MTFRGLVGVQNGGIALNSVSVSPPQRSSHTNSSVVQRGLLQLEGAGRCTATLRSLADGTQHGGGGRPTQSARRGVEGSSYRRHGAGWGSDAGKRKGRASTPSTPSTQFAIGVLPSHPKRSPKKHSRAQTQALYKQQGGNLCSRVKRCWQRRARLSEEVFQEADATKHRKDGRQSSSSKREGGIVTSLIELLTSLNQVARGEAPCSVPAALSRHHHSCPSLSSDATYINISDITMVAVREAVAAIRGGGRRCRVGSRSEARGGGRVGVVVFGRGSVAVIVVAVLAIGEAVELAWRRRRAR